MDLYNDLQQKIKELNISIKKLRETGTAYAEAERDYKLLLRKEILKLRDEGQAIGVITLICYGIPQRNLRYANAKEKIKFKKSWKYQIEWGLKYIKKRYKNPTKAWNFWKKHHWY